MTRFPEVKHQQSERLPKWERNLENQNDQEVDIAKIQLSPKDQKEKAVILD